MYLDFTAEQQALRKEIRDYYRELLTPEIRSALADDETGGPVYREVVGRMGDDGKLSVRCAPDHVPATLAGLRSG